MRAHRSQTGTISGQSPDSGPAGAPGGRESSLLGGRRRTDEGNRTFPAGRGRPARPRRPGSWVSDTQRDIGEVRGGGVVVAGVVGFDALSASAKKPILFWVTSAKRTETRTRRIAEVLRYVAVGRSPLEWPRRPLED